ncbi:MAG TPA: vanadium-dependent haloperoxidase [Puia sp.]|nr:vanadium-dependent haloperoxidase [Puia sp.]
MQKIAAILTVFCLLTAGVKGQELRNTRDLPDSGGLRDAAFLHRSIKAMTDIMVHDIYSPPVASRIYAYISVAGYEACRHADPHYRTLAAQLRGLTPADPPTPGKKYNYSLAAAHAILVVGKSLVISEEKVEDFHTKILREFRDAGMSQEVFDNSVEFGKQVAEHILAWAAGDNYKQSRALPKFAVTDDPGSWKPTAPSYMKAVEPHWNEIRTFLIDSAQQFKPDPSPPFSTDTNTRFYKEAKYVFETSQHLSAEQVEIANFWDCNPFKMNINGHVMYASKKISPGGHWVNITGLACKKAHAGLVRSAEAYVCIAVTLADCFINCWDEKYRSTVIRPETYINQYISESWMPVLQTPPFPEYTSGHSVVSAAAATVLTRLFGENFQYADSTEIEFKIPVRRFTSFKQAAEEAGISRLYGGIHYMPSIKNGLNEGYAIGEYAVLKLRTRQD